MNFLKLLDSWSEMLPKADINFKIYELRSNKTFFITFMHSVFIFFEKYSYLIIIIICY